jgi:hypothetical protein
VRQSTKTSFTITRGLHLPGLSTVLRCRAYVVLDGTLIPVDRSLGMPVSSLGGGAPGSAFPAGPVWRLGQDRGDQGCERVMGAGWPLGACTRPRPTSWTTATR